MFVNLEAKVKNNPYRILGLGLIIAGVIFAAVAYLIIKSTPLTATGLSSIDWLYQYCPGKFATADFSGSKPNDI